MLDEMPPVPLDEIPTRTILDDFPTKTIVDEIPNNNIVDKIPTINPRLRTVLQDNS